MQQLALRIHDMKRDAIDQESDLGGLGYVESLEARREAGTEVIDTPTPTFEFKSRDDISREIKGKKKINPLDYVNSRDLVSIRRNTTEFLMSSKALIDLRPAALAKAITQNTKLILEKQFGRIKEVVDKNGNITLEKVARKD